MSTPQNSSDELDDDDLGMTSQTEYWPTLPRSEPLEKLIAMLISEAAEEPYTAGYRDGLRSSALKNPEVVKWFYDRQARNGDCIEWKGSRTGKGYGGMRLNSVMTPTHRIAYELAKGRIPRGLQIDHLCENKICCNPEHLEAVTNRVNSARGMVKMRRTHCKRGHEFTPDSVYYTQKPDGVRGRTCKICSAIRSHERNERLKLERQRLLAITKGGDNGDSN